MPVISAGDQLWTAEVLLEYPAGGPRFESFQSFRQEFLIAAIGPSPDAEAISARLGAAIAALPQGLTASIGTATAELSPMGTSDIPGLIEKLIDVADSAMYTAKRRGGNQAHHL